jgi:hypothetical protein
MSHDSEVSDALSWAIGEFREELLLWIDTELSRLREQEPAEKAARRPVIPPEPKSALEPRAPVSNPRQRLDALARLLDHRLKQARGASESSRGADQEPNKGAEDHTP